MHVVQTRDVLARALAFDHLAGDTDDGRVWRRRGNNDRARTNPAATADMHGADHRGSGADHHVVLDRRMALLLLEAGASQRYALVDKDVVADFRGLADHHAHPMVDEQSSPDGGAGMDFDAGDPTGKFAQKPAEKTEAMLPKPMRRAVHPDRVQPRVGKHYFEHGARGRVAVENRLDVLAHPADRADRRLGLDARAGGVRKSHRDYGLTAAPLREVARSRGCAPLVAGGCLTVRGRAASLC